MRRLRLIDAVLILGVAALVAFTLAPAVARIQRTSAESKCQSNLRVWAEAMALYLSDNYSNYPTNRARNADGTLGIISHYGVLSPPETDPATDRPYRLYYSINWVEALYPYVWDRATRTGQDWKAFRTCPNRRPGTWPTPYDSGYPFPCMSYTLNANVVEQSAVLIRDSSKLLMLREYYKSSIALLRPMNSSLGASAAMPQLAFNNGDLYATTEENADPQVWKLHGEGSYITFADGHVQYFTLDYFPTRTQTTATACWDAETQQWWNWASGSGKPAELVKKIAITP